MQYIRRFTRHTGFIAVLISWLVFMGNIGHVSAASMTIPQQITVTAIIPSHRDIILDTAGRIVQITSNTKDDVTPAVYRGSATPENTLPLTSELLASYRQLVPVGTAKYGVLYQQNPLASISKPTGITPGASTAAAFANPPLHRLLRANFAASQFAYL